MCSLLSTIPRCKCWAYVVMAGVHKRVPEASIFRRQQNVNNLNNYDGFRELSQKKPSVSAVETTGFRRRNHRFLP